MSVGGREGRKALKGDVGGVIFFNVGKYGFGGESDTIEGNFGIELIESSFDFWLEIILHVFPEFAVYLGDEFLEGSKGILYLFLVFVVEVFRVQPVLKIPHLVANLFVVFDGGVQIQWEVFGLIFDDP